MECRFFEYSYENAETKKVYKFRVKIYFPTKTLFDSELPPVADLLGVPMIMAPQLQWRLALFYNDLDVRLFNIEKTLREPVLKVRILRL